MMYLINLVPWIEHKLTGKSMAAIIADEFRRATKGNKLSGKRK
jgi:hypothetical protein